ncbi:MAG: CinA family nicotinamide mononucleotide deamidase-related protein [Candidatus Omnitrophica bacterium]|nr:CinA family nicotinamide mononucleotide deamidase-related protein [Candidatus Omnitrophota bacterium]
MALFKNLRKPLGSQDRKRPKVFFLTVGAELLNGSVLNSNASFLGRHVMDLGFSVIGQNSCCDEISSIKANLKWALDRADIVFVTGGLGPTPDDVTRESLAGYFGLPLIFSRLQYQQIVHFYRVRGRKVPKIVKREALFPKNAKQVVNRFGIALGFIMEERGKIVVVLPGVPGELIRLFEHSIRPYLRNKFPYLRPKTLLIAKVTGLSEPTVMSRLGTSFFKHGDFQFGIYPDIGEVSLRLYSDSNRVMRKLKRHIARVMQTSIFAFSDESMESVIGRKLRSKGLTLSLAESCTGGLVAEILTRVPGASDYLVGSVVAYSNKVKTHTLNVSKKIIETRGAVSEESARAMAKGVRAAFNTDLGISITGIAGPSGGTKTKPVGLVYIAIDSGKKNRAWKEFFRGDREQIRARAAKKALEYLWRWLEN